MAGNKMKPGGKNKWQKKQKKAKSIVKKQFSKMPDSLIKSNFAHRTKGMSVDTNLTTHDLMLKVQQYFVWQGSEPVIDPARTGNQVGGYAFDTTALYAFPPDQGADTANQNRVRLTIDEVLFEIFQPTQDSASSQLQTRMVQALFQVPVRAASNFQQSSQRYVATTVTNISPTVTPAWIEVLRYKPSEVYDNTSNVPIFADEATQILANWEIVNPSDGTSKRDTFLTDIRVTISFRQPVPVSSNIRSSVNFYADWNSNLTIANTGEDTISVPIRVVPTDNWGLVGIDGLKVHKTQD
jgi:hypothetical protein